MSCFLSFCWTSSPPTSFLFLTNCQLVSDYFLQICETPPFWRNPRLPTMYWPFLFVSWHDFNGDWCLQGYWYLNNANSGWDFLVPHVWCRLTGERFHGLPFPAPVFLYLTRVDIDQLKLIMLLVGTPGPELLMKISSESVSPRRHARVLFFLMSF